MERDKLGSLSFDVIQRILRRLSKKQLDVVARMVRDLQTRYIECPPRPRAPKPVKKQGPPPRSRIIDDPEAFCFGEDAERIGRSTGKLPMFDPSGAPSDDEVVRSFNPLSRLSSRSQMERICGVGNGAAMQELERHLDTLAPNHGDQYEGYGDEW